MNNALRIGAVQRDILRALRDGNRLYQNGSEWWLVSVHGLRYSVNGNSCGGLATRGLIRVGVSGSLRVSGFDQYEITDTGRKALG